MWLTILVALLQIILYIWVVVWIKNVRSDKNCKCAHNWRSKYILFYPVCLFIYEIIIISIILSNFKNDNLIQIISLLSLPILICLVLFIIFSIQYLKQIHESKCECAYKNKSGDNALTAIIAIKLVSLLLTFISVVVIF